MPNKNGAIVADVPADKSTAGDNQNQPGSENNAGEGKKTLGLPDRNAALTAIARQHEESYGIKREDPPVEDPEENPEEDPALDPEEELEDPDNPEDPEALPGDDPEEDPENNDDPLKAIGYYKNEKGVIVTKMKINGVEREVPAAQVRDYLQKDIAGDMKLQQANERLNQLNEREKKLKDLETNLQKQQKRGELSEQDAAALREKVKAAFEKQWDGDIDGATEAFIELVSSNRVDPEQLRAIAQETTQSTIEQTRQDEAKKLWTDSKDEGIREVEINHPEVSEDPELWELANFKTARMLEARAKGDPEYINLMPKDIILKAVAEVEKLHGITPKTPQPGNKKPSDRQGRKDGLKPVVRGMDAAKRPAPKQEKDLSTSAVIENMRKSRAGANFRGE